MLRVTSLTTVFKAHRMLENRIFESFADPLYSGDQLKAFFKPNGIRFLLVCLFLLSPNLRADTLIVTDQKTGLKWIKEEVEAMTWSSAMNYCDTLQVSGYSDWRLPSIEELKTSYAIRDTFPGFPDEDDAYYWSSTVNKDYADYAHGMYAEGGYPFDDGHKDSRYLVRCVRNKLKAFCVSGNCKNGYGVFLFANGDKYEGRWKNGKRHGYGVYTWSGGKQYQGEFRDNRRVK